jgi:hypothetical protein
MFESPLRASSSLLHNAKFENFDAIRSFPRRSRQYSFKRPSNLWTWRVTNEFRRKNRTRRLFCGLDWGCPDLVLGAFHALTGVAKWLRSGPSPSQSFKTAFFFLRGRGGIREGLNALRPSGAASTRKLLKAGLVFTGFFALAMIAGLVGAEWGRWVDAFDQGCSPSGSRFGDRPCASGIDGGSSR